MTHDEVVDLLTLAAVYDQRTGGQSDVRGWHAVAQIERWTAPTAQRVVIEHYSRGADRPRITPAAISDGIRAVRRKAADSFAVCDPPEDLAGRDYPGWYRAHRDAHIARVLDVWAAGEPIPEPSAALDYYRQAALTMGPDTSTCPSGLREQIVRDIAQTGRERPASTRPAGLPYRPSLDPDRREQARVELDAIRPARAVEPQSDEDQLCAT